MTTEESARDPLKLRAKHGADTPIGHRCSNLIGQLGFYSQSVGETRKQLKRNIAQQVADLKALTKR
jgi:hypothetical protein